MKSIIIGGGKIGYYLVKTLKDRDYEIVLIERDKQLCKEIAEDLNINIICGDGTDIDVLRDAEIEDAEVVAAVTGMDEENLVICQIAKASFNINKTIARINNPKNISMFSALGVDKTVCSTEVIANLIEYEFDKENIKIIQTFECGSMLLVEIKIDNENPWCNNFIKDLALSNECVVISVIRDDNVTFPRGNTRILENDKVFVLTNNSGLMEIRRQLLIGGTKYAWFKK